MSWWANLRGGRALAGGSLVLLAAAAACKGETEEHEGDGAADSGGSAGVGTASGTGGSSGAAGSPATGGGSGVAGASALGGATGSAGSAGSVTAPAGCAQTSFVEEELIARAVVPLTSCLADDGFWRSQMYLRETQGGYQYVGGRELARCLSAVTTGCDGALGCFGLSARSGEACGTCQGNTAVSCGDRELLWDCSRFGGVCNAGQCEYPTREACDETDVDRCDEQGRPVQCDDFLDYGPSCPTLGLACAVDGYYASCHGTGASCAWEDSPYPDIDYQGVSCAGSVLSACVEGQLGELRCECLGAGFSCQTAGAVAFCGSESECDPRSYVKTCDGTNAVLCIGGKVTRLDCRSFGFSSCSTDEDTACAP